jgi:hypothetical protein
MFKTMNTVSPWCDNQSPASSYHFFRNCLNSEDSGMIRPSHVSGPHNTEAKLLLWRCRRYIPPKCGTAQKNNIVIFTAVRTPWRCGERNPRLQFYRQSGHNYQLALAFFFKMCAITDILQLKTCQIKLERQTIHLQNIRTLQHRNKPESGPELRINFIWTVQPAEGFRGQNLITLAGKGIYKLVGLRDTFLLTRPILGFILYLL